MEKKLSLGGGCSRSIKKIMLLLFLDCETNGLPLNRLAPFTAIEMWPRLIQLSWQIIDYPSWEVVEEHDYFVKSDAIWSKDAERIHRIPEGIVQKFGKPVSDVLKHLAVSIGKADKVISHNLSFDRTTILAEYQRLWLAGCIDKRPKEVWSKADICTMVATKNFCAIPFPSGAGYKFPKLEELYEKLFGKKYDISGAELHNSANDVSCLISCVRELDSRRLITLL